MRRFLRLTVVLAALAGAVLSSSDAPAGATADLRDVAQAHGIEVGAAVRPVSLASDPLYSQSCATLC